MSAGCRYEGCTVADTGRCALERNPAECSNRIGNVPADETPAPLADHDDTSAIGAPVLEAPTEIPSFPPSTTLGPETIAAMMATRYLTVVGILGDPESGKTACLASLYLLVSNAELDGWSFGDSRSLMAFEEIARGARRWNDGHPPEQMTVHTEMADERRPGFLHLRLRRRTDGRCIDLVMPDLPGEWTKTLIRSARSDRLEFLKSADVIWLVADGRALADREKRQGTITRLGQLAGRLRAMIEASMPRLLLVITHRDRASLDGAVLDRIRTEFDKHSVSLEIIPVAPFSDRDEIRAGFGLASLIDASVGRSRGSPAFWPATPPKEVDRSFLTYRRDR
jgi:hypothetical protein